MRTISYLIFDSQAEEAMQFYKGVFGGEITYVMRGKEAEDMQVKAEDRDKILHGELKVNEDFILYFSDSFSETSIVAGNNYSIHIMCESLEEIQEVFNKLVVNGHVTMPLEDTFWNAKFGSLTDQYGFHWNLNYSYE